MNELVTLSAPVPLPVHSPLGGSAATRFINCPGSPALIQRIGQRKVTTEADWTRHGTAAHKVVAHCLANKQDVWEVMSEDWDGILFEPDEVAAMQGFVDFVHERVRAIEKAHGTASLYVEFPLAHPEIHELFYGQLDVGIIAGKYAAILDYKHGEGVAVEVEMNAQLLYYAAGFVYDFLGVDWVELWVYQPRAFHPAGPARSWMISAAALMHWLRTILVPAMNLADPRQPQLDNPLNPDDSWCRFCPAKLACPAIKRDLVAVEESPLAVHNASNEELAELLSKIPRARMVIKALLDEGQRRLMDGADIPGQKLVLETKWRKWKPSADAAFRAKYGNEAFDTKLKSPAQMEALIGAQPLVDEHAFTPTGGYTIAPVDSKKTAINLKRVSVDYPLPPA